MRAEAWVFSFWAIFMYTIGGIYAWGTAASTTLDWAGTVALGLSGTLGLICGMYFGFIARRIEPRPEDRDGEVSERAGSLGFFAPHSYWPFAMGLMITTGALGIALHQGWLLAIGLAGGIAAACGLTFQFYHGARAAPAPSDNTDEGRQQQ